MAELLVRVVDKVNPDFYMDCQCTKRGDVIVVQEDGWKWGREEKSLPFYRIIRIPGMSVSEASQFLAPELPIDPLNPSKTLKRRAFKFDLDAPTLPKGFGDFIADEKRDVAVLDAASVGLAKADILSIKTEKDITADPAVIGDVKVVIG